MRIIPISVIAFILLGTLISCDSDPTNDSPPCDTCDVPCDTCDTTQPALPPTWEQLRKTKFAHVFFGGEHSIPAGPTFFESFFKAQPEWDFVVGSFEDTAINRLVWSSDSVSNDPFLHLTLSAHVNASRTTVDSFKLYKFQHYKTNRESAGATYRLEGRSIPFWGYAGDTIIYSISDSIVKDHLTKISIWCTYNADRTFYSFEAYQSTDWHSKSNPPQITLRFY